MNEFRWGLLGTGFVARKFAWGLRSSSTGKPAVVASRSLERAAEFARTLRIPRAYGNYEEAINDSAVDAWYVATPPSLHHEHALLCLNSGRPVLVEKPFAVSGQQAREIAAVARARATFCMEAMWTRFLPTVRRLKRMIDDGVAGEVRLLSGSFGIAEAVNPANPLFNESLGGGALLDRAVYPVSLAFHLMGKPERITSEVLIGNTGVDEEAAAMFRYANGGIGLFTASLRTRCSNDFTVMGTRSTIHVHTPVYRPYRITVTPVQSRTYAPSSGIGRIDAVKESNFVQHVFQRLGSFISAVGNRSTKHYADYYTGNGYHYEADEVMRCVQNGKTESDIMPLSQSVGVIDAIDTIRGQLTSQCGPLRTQGEIL